MHIASQDVKKSGTFNYEALATALSVAQIIVGGLIEIPAWLDALGKGLDLLTIAGLPDSIKVLEGGSVDILMLQVAGFVGYLYEASLLDLGNPFIVPVITGLPGQYLETPMPFYSQVWFLWSSEQSHSAREK